jgi:hypothetical protein
VWLYDLDKGHWRAISVSNDITDPLSNIIQTCPSSEDAIVKVVDVKSKLLSHIQSSCMGGRLSQALQLPQETTQTAS